VADGRAALRRHGAATPVAIIGMRFLDEDRLLTLDNAGRLEIRDVGSGQLASTALVPGAGSTMAMDPGTRRIAVGGHQGSLHVLSLPGLSTAAHREEAMPSRVSAMTLRNDGRLLVAGTETGDLVLFDADTLGTRLAFPRLTGQVNNLNFDPSGRLLAVASVEQDVSIWDVERLLAGLESLGPGAGVLWGGAQSVRGRWSRV